MSLSACACGKLARTWTPHAMCTPCAEQFWSGILTAARLVRAAQPTAALQEALVADLVALIPFEPHYNAKLTAAQVQDIRARHEAGESEAALGKQFGVSQSNVHYLLSGRTWRRMAA